MDDQTSQVPDAYHQTACASLDLIWQLRKQLGIGLEGLYGHEDTQDGSNGDVGC
jgi:hypothetical protein